MKSVKTTTKKVATKATKTKVVKFKQTTVRKGVYTTPNGNYRARIKNNGTSYSKTFKTIKAAVEWRNSIVNSK